MHYTFPPIFEIKRATELATLIDAAYDQLNKFKAGTPWISPAGYGNVSPFSSTEPWLKPAWPPVWPPAPPAAPLPFGFVTKKGNDVYVVIRGTQTTLEWLDDVTIQAQLFDPANPNWGKTTQGFGGIHSQILPQIIASLEAIQNDGNNLGSVYVTGHSLGAALAHLAAAGIYLRFGIRPTSYTFCGPRAGDPVFAQAYQAAVLPTWRIFNTEDIVPDLPAAAIEFATPNMGMNPLGGPLNVALPTLIKLFPSPYQHVGYPVAVTFHSNIVADNHNLDNNVTEMQRP